MKGLRPNCSTAIKQIAFCGFPCPGNKNQNSLFSFIMILILVRWGKLLDQNILSSWRVAEREFRRRAELLCMRPCLSVFLFFGPSACLSVCLPARFAFYFFSITFFRFSDFLLLWFKYWLGSRRKKSLDKIFTYSWGVAEREFWRNFVFNFYFFWFLHFFFFWFLFF